MRFSKDEKNTLWVLAVLFSGIAWQAISSGNSLWTGVAVMFGLLVMIILFTGNARRTRITLDELSRNNQGTIALYSVLKPEFPLPEMGGYALSAAKAAKLMELVLDKKPKLIVELGSGVSTVISAYCMKKLGGGKIISFDHDKQFADITRENIAKHGLSEYVDIVHAPLAEVTVGQDKFKWYDIDISLVTQGIDLLFVDGPPRKTQNRARYPAVRFFRDKLNSGAIVLLDDANRPHEIEIKKLWLAENPELVKDSSYFRNDMFIAAKK